MVIETFDTHAYVKELYEAGIPTAQAEVFASLKLDIVRLSNRMDERFTLLEAQVDKKLEALHAKLIKWMFGFFVSQVAATLTMIRFMT